MGIANGVLLMFRTTPFTAADLRLLKYGATLLTTYLSWPQIIMGAAALGAAVLVCVLLWKKAPVDPCPVNLTESVCVAAVASTVIWAGLNLAVFTQVVAVHLAISDRPFRIMDLPTVLATQFLIQELKTAGIRAERIGAAKGEGAGSGKYILS